MAPKWAAGRHDGERLRRRERGHRRTGIRRRPAPPNVIQRNFRRQAGLVHGVRRRHLQSRHLRQSVDRRRTVGQGRRHRSHPVAPPSLFQ